MILFDSALASPESLGSVSLHGLSLRVSSLEISLPFGSENSLTLLSMVARVDSPV